jgi:hypothetical protein
MGIGPRRQAPHSFAPSLDLGNFDLGRHRSIGNQKSLCSIDGSEIQPPELEVVVLMH